MKTFLWKEIRCSAQKEPLVHTDQFFRAIDLKKKDYAIVLAFVTAHS
jgi:hypothetical protein